jgi:hypothetical protein
MGGAVRFVTHLVVVAISICDLTTAFLPTRNSPRSRLQESTPIFTFHHPTQIPAARTVVRRSSNTNTGDADVSALEEEEEEMADVPLLDVDPDVASKFKVVTCMSTACSKKRTEQGMDEYSTFAAFWSRSRDRTLSEVEVEESPCLGYCKQAPCVGILHEDYDGPVALEGMDQAEFNAKVFQRIVTEDDADRAWSCVENAIITMAEEEEEDDEEESEEDEDRYV